jgi:hypothetical protein
MRIHMSRIIHLIGMRDEVKKASEEIHHYAFLHGFGSKQIEYNNLYNELKYNGTRDLYVNNAGLLSCKEMERLHYSFRSEYKFYSSILHVNQPTEYCPYIQYIYNLKENVQKKENLICKILFE